MKFLSKGIPTQVVMNNLVRFLSGNYFASGFLFVYAAFNIFGLGLTIYILGIIVIFPGLGRLFSRVKVGTAGKRTLKKINF